MSTFKIETTINIPSIDCSVFIHNPDNTIDLYTKINSNYNKLTSEIDLGLWNDISFDDKGVICLDEDSTDMSSSSIVDTFSVFVWKDGKSHRIAVIPDNSPIYAPTSINRLYYATDTKIMYQNIADTWQMVGTLRHELMDNIGKYSHSEVDTKLDEIDVKLTEISEKLEALEGNTPDSGEYTHSNIDTILKAICDKVELNINDLIQAK